MRPIAYTVFAILICAGPASARDHLRHGPRASRGHGIPIIAGNNDIRINAVGEVLSTPPPPISSQQPRKLPPAGPSGAAVKP